MKKCTQTISVDCDVLQQARIRKLNISKASQEGIEQALNLPFTWEDLQREKIELEQKLGIILERMDELKGNFEFERKQKQKSLEQLSTSVDLIIKRHLEQPPVPYIVWESQAKVNNLTVDELKLKVNTKLVESGMKQID